MTNPSDPAGAFRVPLCAKEPADTDDARSSSRADLLWTAERPRGVNVTPTDPRAPRLLSDRDITALTFLGEAGEAAQGQLHIACFNGRAESIVSRWVRRMAAKQLIVVDRWNRVGINRLRLSTAGRALLIEHGVEASRLFAPRAPLAPGIVAHNLTIIDVLVALRTATPAPARILTAWSIQRSHRDAFPVIPDLLAVFTRPDGAPRLVLAIEVDLGSESLRRAPGRTGSFLTKLQVLRETLSTLAGDARSAILVLTKGERRINAVRSACGADTSPVPVLVEGLPDVEGRQRINALRDLVSPPRQE